MVAGYCSSWLAGWLAARPARDCRAWCRQPLFVLLLLLLHGLALGLGGVLAAWGPCVTGCVSSPRVAVYCAVHCQRCLLLATFRTEPGGPAVWCRPRRPRPASRAAGEAGGWGLHAFLSRLGKVPEAGAIWRMHYLPALCVCDLSPFRPAVRLPANVGACKAAAAGRLRCTFGYLGLGGRHWATAPGRAQPVEATPL